MGNSDRSRCRARSQIHSALDRRRAGAPRRSLRPRRPGARWLERLGSAPAAQRSTSCFRCAPTSPGSSASPRGHARSARRRTGDYEPLATLARRFGAAAAERRGCWRTCAAPAPPAQDRRDRPVRRRDDAGRAAAAAVRHLAGPVPHRPARGVDFVAPAGARAGSRGAAGAVTGVVGLDTRPLCSARPRRAGLRARRAAAHAVHGRPTTAPSGYSARTGTAGRLRAGVARSGFTPNQYLTAYGYPALQARASAVRASGWR